MRATASHCIGGWSSVSVKNRIKLACLIVRAYGTHSCDCSDPWTEMFTVAIQILLGGKGSCYAVYGSGRRGPAHFPELPSSLWRL